MECRTKSIKSNYRHVMCVCVSFF